MSRKIWSIILAIILLGILGAGYVFLKSGFATQASPYKAVPPDAALIIESTGFNKIISRIREDNMIWDQLKSMEAVKKADRKLAFIDSLLLSDNEFYKLFGDRNFLCSVHQTGKNDLELLILLNTAPNTTFSGLNKVISEIPGPGNNIRIRNYQKTRIVELSDKSKKLKYVYSLYKGVFLFSSSPILVESAIRQLDLDNNILLENGFLDVKKTAGKNTAANLYVSFEDFHRFLSVFMSNEMNKWLRSINSFANWAELDFHAGEDKIMLNGFSYSNNISNNYLDIFAGQSPQKIEVDRLLPDNTVNYIAFGISDFEEFFKKRKNYLASGNKFQGYKLEIDKLRDLLGIDIIDMFSSLIGNEAVLAHTGIKNIDESENRFALLKINSASQARLAILKLLENYSKSSSIPLENMIYEANIDEEKHFQVYKLPSSNIPELLFGGFFNNSDFTYMSFVEDYMIFGNSIRSISNFIHYQLLQQTLINDFDYREFLETLSSRSNILFYAYAPRSTELLQRILNEEYVKGLAEHEEILKKVQAIGFQISVENMMYYNNLTLKYQAEYKEKAETQWESMLDATLLSKPVFVTNHNTGAKEIFIQDEKNNIYLINSAGRILWRMNIPEKIISDIYQIDFYRNNKLQILFNTSNYIYLIDRNGNNVENYPVKLRSEAGNGIMIFDYEKNKDYRFCLTGIDKKVYLFTKEGKIVNGWSLPETESIVRSPVRHFRSGTKDYIVFSDDYKFYILNRRGNIRVEVKETIKKPAKQNILFVKHKGESKFVTTQSDGTVCFIDLEGNIEKRTFQEFSPDHYFDYKDINGDGKFEFIFLDGRELKVFNSNGKKRFSYEFKSEISNKPVFYTFSAKDIKIGVVSVTDGLIYLINNDGNLYNNFPLSGQTLFSIGKFRSSSSKYSLIVGGEDNFLYNYSVN